VSKKSKQAHEVARIEQSSGPQAEQARQIEISHLHDNPYQPRNEMSSERLAELAGVIRSKGFQGVLVARPDPDQPGYYQLTAGHRRRDAAGLAGLDSLPVLVHQIGDGEMVELAITENIQREDLSPLEEGHTYLLMIGELGYTHEQIAQSVGKSRGYVENRIRAARAPQDVQELVRDKPDSLRAIATLVKIKDNALRGEVIWQLRNGKLTVDEIAGYLEEQGGQQHRVAESLHKQGRPAKASDPLVEERVMQRVGSGKLAVALRSLLGYRATLAHGRELSERERASLFQLASLMDELQGSLDSK